MRKSKWMLLIAAGLAAGSIYADNGWGLYAGYWDTKDAGSGLGPGLRLSIEIIEYANLDIRASYFRDVAGSDDVLDATLQVVPVEAALNFNLSPLEMMNVFGGFGIGYYWLDGDVTLPGGSKHSANPDDEIGYFLNAGVELSIGDELADYGSTRVTIFAEVQYRFLQVDGVTIEDGGTYTIKDGDLDGVVGNAGLMVRW
jgi:hypothetical protein